MPTTPLIDVLTADGRIAGSIMWSRLGIQVTRRPYARSTTTPSQRLWRNAFRTADMVWRILSLADRQAWNAYRSWTHLTGYSQFMRVNIKRQASGLPLYTNPDQIPI